MKKSLETIGVVVGATIGSGVFVLPYIIQEAGWLLTLGYFIALIAVISLAHILYLRTLEAVDEKKRLLGLARTYFGGMGFWIGFIAIVIGLLLSFVAYFVLGAQFIQIIIPGISPLVALAIFWFAIATLVFKSEGKVAGLEIVGVVLIFCAILFVFISGHPTHAFINTPLVALGNLFLPFGASLFALAGWTSVEQVYEINKKNKRAKRLLPLFLVGTGFAGVLYWLFALGMLGSVPHVSVDITTNIGNWIFWKKDILAAIGLLAMGVVSIPIAREIRGALEKDLSWNNFISRAIIIILPLAIVLSGFNNFLVIVSLAGGIFISVQYILIILVGRRTLQFSDREKTFLDILVVVFACVVIYEIVSFIVR